MKVVVIQEEGTSDNTALTHRRYAHRSGDEADKETDLSDNPSSLSLRTRFAARHLSLSGSFVNAKTLNEISQDLGKFKEEHHEDYFNSLL